MQHNNPPKFTPSHIKTVVDEKVTQYVRSVGMREPEILKQLREKSQEVLGMASLMVSTPEQTQLLQLIVKLAGIKNVLEVGTLTGYSTLAFALAADDIHVTTLDINQEWTNVGKEFWKEANVSDRITSIVKPAMETLQELKDQKKVFDFVYIDADKQNQLKYIEYAYDLLQTNGLLVIDNVLWGTKVIDEDSHGYGCDEIKEMNKKLHVDERWDLAMTTIGDGATFLRKR